MKVDLESLYRMQLEKYLAPQIDTLTENEIVLFYAKPSFEPEFSIRIIERGNQCFIEGRFIDKNIWLDLIEHYIKKEKKAIQVEVCLYTMPISNDFQEKILANVASVIQNKKITDEMLLDGTSYEFWTFDKINRVRSVEVNSPDSGTIEETLIKFFMRITNDLRSQTFDEKKYW
jgi:hypothetical protein